MCKYSVYSSYTSLNVDAKERGENNGNSSKGKKKGHHKDIAMLEYTRSEGDLVSLNAITQGFCDLVQSEVVSVGLVLKLSLRQYRFIDLPVHPEGYDLTVFNNTGFDDVILLRNIYGQQDNASPSIKVAVKANSSTSEYFMVIGGEVVGQTDLNYAALLKDPETNQGILHTGSMEFGVWSRPIAVDYNALSNFSPLGETSGNVCYDKANPPNLLDNEQLKDCGGPKEVKGVVTDGLSRLLLKINAGIPGKLCFKVVPDSNFPGYEGETTPIDDTELQTPLNDGTYWGFSTYISPGEFRDGTNKSHRTIKVQYAFTPKDRNGEYVSTISEVGEAEIDLYRPPEILVDNIWRTMPWRFSPFNTQRADLEFEKLVKFGDIDDGALSKKIPKLKEAITDQLNKVIYKGIAATKVDVIAHGVGGILAKATLNDLKTSSNFNEGAGRKLITISTPHNGTGMANMLISTYQHALANATFYEVPIFGLRGLGKHAKIIPESGRRAIKEKIEGFKLRFPNPTIPSNTVFAWTFWPLDEGVMCDIAENSTGLGHELTGVKTFALTSSGSNLEIASRIRTALSEFYGLDYETYMAPYDWNWGNRANDGFVSVASQQQFDIEPEPVSETGDSIQLQLRYQPPMGGGSYSRKREAMERKLAAQAVVETQTLQVRSEVARLWSSWQELRVIAPRLDERVEASDKVVKAYDLQFAAARRTLTDLIDSRNDHYRARVEVVNNLMDQHITSAQLLSLIGKLRESLLTGGQTPVR